MNAHLFFHVCIWSWRLPFNSLGYSCHHMGPRSYQAHRAPLRVGGHLWPLSVNPTWRVREENSSIPSRIAPAPLNRTFSGKFNSSEVVNQWETDTVVHTSGLLWSLPSTGVWSRYIMVMFVDLGFEACSHVPLTVNILRLQSRLYVKNMRKTDACGSDGLTHWSRLKYPNNGWNAMKFCTDIKHYLWNTGRIAPPLWTLEHADIGIHLSCRPLSS